MSEIKPTPRMLKLVSDNVQGEIDRCKSPLLAEVMLRYMLHDDYSVHTPKTLAEKLMRDEDEIRPIFELLVSDKLIVKTGEGSAKGIGDDAKAFLAQGGQFSIPWAMYPGYDTLGSEDILNAMNSLNGLVTFEYHRRFDIPIAQLVNLQEQMRTAVEEGKRKEHEVITTLTGMPADAKISHGPTFIEAHQPFRCDELTACVISSWTSQTPEEAVRDGLFREAKGFIKYSDGATRAAGRPIISHALTVTVPYEGDRTFSPSVEDFMRNQYFCVLPFACQAEGLEKFSQVLEKLQPYKKKK